MQADIDVAFRVLNEVLSITAQESARAAPRGGCRSLLNEVLSITAQECSFGVGEHSSIPSSMKS